MSNPVPVYPAFPRLGTPFVDSNGNISIPWYRLLISIWQQIGGGKNSAASVYLGIADDGSLTAYSSIDGSVIGPIEVSGGVPAPAQPQTLSTSPFVFEAQEPGTLVVGSGKLELERSPDPYRLVGLVGGAVPVLIGDLVRVTWTSLAPPTVFYPSSQKVSAT